MMVPDYDFPRCVQCCVVGPTCDVGDQTCRFAKLAHDTWRAVFTSMQPVDLGSALARNALVPAFAKAFRATHEAAHEHLSVARTRRLEELEAEVARLREALEQIAQRDLAMHPLPYGARLAREALAKGGG